ncbi:conserved oligomeric Golgi complex subunit 4, partial [Phenoliferia sp. Uapishka_3]
MGVPIPPLNLVTATDATDDPPIVVKKAPLVDLSSSSLTSRSIIEQHLATLQSKESTFDNRLSNLISSRSRLNQQLNALEGLREVVEGIQAEAQHMAQKIRGVASTAERVGGKVRVLDEEQSRVRASIEVVTAVQELKSSIAGLDAAIQKQDWEAATRLMQRATAIDPDIVASGFAEAVVPTSTLPLPPPQTLATLRASLLDTFLTSFRTASSTGDTNNINRFFKLFPMIGEEDTGLDAYADWVSGIVRAKTAALPSKIASALLSEADRIGLRVIQSWIEERRIRKKVAESKEYTFPGLGGPKKRPVAAGTVGGAGASPAIGSEEEKVDPREVDALLAELAMMSGRWQLLRRFLYDRLKEDDEPPSPTTIENVPGDDAPPPSAKLPVTPSTPIPPPSDDLPMVEASALGAEISTQLSTVYQPLEIWYLRSSIEKSHLMDELDLSSPPSLSSSLDDTFYILKKTLYRLLSTSDIATMVDMAKELRSIMERDVADVWRVKMEGAFKDVANGGGVGRAREEEKDRREKEAKAVYIVYLNNLDTAAEYTVRLVEEILSGEALNEAFFLGAELERARIAIVGVRGVEDKFRGVLKSALDHLFNQLLRPRLRPILSDVYKDVTYILDEDSYAEAEYRDDVRKRFVKAWEALLFGYRESLTPTNFNLFFATAVNVLVRPWEGMIRGMKFTELGALRLDRDIRSILSYLSSQSSYSSGSLRESFSRLQQIATLLTLDTPEEAEEVLSATGNRLTNSEVKIIMALRYVFLFLATWTINNNLFAS